MNSTNSLVINEVERLIEKILDQIETFRAKVCNDSNDSNSNQLSLELDNLIYKIKYEHEQSKSKLEETTAADTEK